MEMSNHLDSTPTSTVSKITSSSFADLPSHLAILGLDKYISKLVIQFNIVSYYNMV